MSRREKVLALRDGQPMIMPSMLLCDFSNLAKELERLESAGFRSLHLDVMDGVFVPNFSYGMTIVSAFRKVTELPLDVHLMMVNPQNYVEAFAEAGADSITFHIEACDDAAAIVKQIHDLGMAAGVAIDRDTDVEAVAGVVEQCDLALVMTIKAGFGGQAFIPSLLDKLHRIREIAGEDVVLQVDGGVNQSTIGQCVEAGAEWLVVGSGVFKESDYQQAHQMLLSRAAMKERNEPC